MEYISDKETGKKLGIFVSDINYRGFASEANGLEGRISRIRNLCMNNFTISVILISDGSSKMLHKKVE
jgi:hypothetical protein